MRRVGNLALGDNRLPDNQGAHQPTGQATESAPDDAKCSGLQRDYTLNKKQAKKDKATSHLEQTTNPKRFQIDYSVRKFLADPKSWFEVAALITVVIYTVYAGLQVSETHTANNLAGQALRQSTEHFRNDQRPYVWFSKDGLGTIEFIRNPNTSPPSGQIVWTFHFTNFGKTPAHDLFTYKAMRIGAENQFRESYGFSLAPRGKGPPLSPTEDMFHTVVSDPGITPEEYARYLVTDRAIAIQLRFEYRDFYGCWYESHACLQRLASGAIQFCQDENYITDCLNKRVN